MSRPKRFVLVIDPTPREIRDPEDLHEQLRYSRGGVVLMEVKNGVGWVPFVGLNLSLIAEARKAEATDSTFGLGVGPSDRRGLGRIVPRTPQSRNGGHWRTAHGKRSANGQ